MILAAVGVPQLDVIERAMTSCAMAAILARPARTAPTADADQVCLTVAHSTNCTNSLRAHLHRSVIRNLLSQKYVGDDDESAEDRVGDPEQNGPPQAVSGGAGTRDAQSEKDGDVDEEHRAHSGDGGPPRVKRGEKDKDRGNAGGQEGPFVTQDRCRPGSLGLVGGAARYERGIGAHQTGAQQQYQDPRDIFDGIEFQTGVIERRSARMAACAFAATGLPMTVRGRCFVDSSPAERERRGWAPRKYAYCRALLSRTVHRLWRVDAPRPDRHACRRPCADLTDALPSMPVTSTAPSRGRE